MFKLNEIKELIKLIDQTSVHELEIENEGTRLSIRKPGKSEVVTVQAAAAPVAQVFAPAPAAVAAPAASQPAAPAAPAEQDNLHKIVSPMVGTFYAAPTPDSAPFAQKGSRVSDKTVVCILEAMKLMNEIEAEVRGEIVEVLVENGQLVEFGQPLFLVKPE